MTTLSYEEKIEDNISKLRDCGKCKCDCVKEVYDTYMALDLEFRVTTNQIGNNFVIMRKAYE